MSLLLLLRHYGPSYHLSLIDVAESLIREGQNSEIAVVTVHMACEIQIELALSKMMARSGLGKLSGVLGDLLPSRNLANEKVRQTYTAISGDEIQHLPFWQAFKELSGLRNRIVHRAGRATIDEARAGIHAARQLTQHVSAILAKPEWQ